ncbi:hypothetical protein GX48_00047 [Paracoccidioides brasiliensis]|nr:hypothetical protein GX48_00047 [Paracoccidioides brasiliensis]
MAEGGFNRDFPLTMDDGSRVLERTPSLLVAGSRTFPNCWQSDGLASWWLSLSTADLKRVMSQVPIRGSSRLFRRRFPCIWQSILHKGISQNPVG